MLPFPPFPVVASGTFLIPVFLFPMKTDVRQRVLPAMAFKRGRRREALVLSRC
jgi:hypothetical protein